MNRLADSLLTPWVAAPRASRWTAVAGVALVGLLEVPFYVDTQGPARALACGLLACCAIGIWWLLLVPSTLWLARDAAALGLPSVRRRANAGVLLHAAISIAAPTLLLTLVMGHLPVWLVAFTLAVVGCVLYEVLPAILLFVLAPLLTVLSWLHGWSWHDAGITALARDASLPTLALAVLAGWRWSRLLHSGVPRAFGLGAPTIWNFHRAAQLGLTGVSGCDADVQRAPSDGSWLAPRVELRGAGPANPERAIRVALGRATMPLTLGSWIRQWIHAGALLAFFGLIVWLEKGFHGGPHPLAPLFQPESADFGLSTLLTPVLAAAVALGCALPVAARWSGSAGGLALLALLPGLGGPADVHRHVIRAALARTATIVAAEFVILCALAWWAPHPAAAMLTAALCCACTLGLAALCVLGAVGGHQLPGWALAVLVLALAALTGVATHAAFVSVGADRWAMLTFALAIAAIALARACRHAWRAVLARPHPFLPGN